MTRRIPKDNKHLGLFDAWRDVRNALDQVNFASLTTEVTDEEYRRVLRSMWTAEKALDEAMGVFIDADQRSKEANEN